MLHPRLWLERVVQADRRVDCRPPAGDREPVHLTDTLPDAPADTEPAPPFDRSYDFKDCRCGDRLDVTLPKRRKNIAFHSADDASGVRLVEFFGAICVPGACDCFELPEWIPAMLF